ncbi:MAG TPA: MFS transporter [Burkholderiales bacterium]|nr:MFS transporter [Burkholderiales bacterium]
MDRSPDRTGVVSAAARIPRAIWALGFVSLLMDVSSELIHSLLPVFLVSALGASATTVGLIEGAAEATALMVKVFSGALSDYWRKRKALAVFGYGLAAISKPLFALASSATLVFSARIIDRIGKGVREAPRDALIADLTPSAVRGATFGLRQSLDTVGAFLGPALAIVLMLAWAQDFRAVFWMAAIPAFLAVALLVVAVPEPAPPPGAAPLNPVSAQSLARLGAAYWWVVGIGATLALARFSEAFLVLRAAQGGLPAALAPLVFIAMNVVYAATAYPFGKLADKLPHERLLAWGLPPLVAGDAVLACSNHWGAVWLGVSLWGLHMGMTQGLLSAMVADAAPADLRGTAYGFFNLASGVALLAGSVAAGMLWDSHGAATTFVAGGVLAALALGAILLRRAV